MTVKNRPSAIKIAISLVGALGAAAFFYLTEYRFNASTIQPQSPEAMVAHEAEEQLVAPQDAPVSRARHTADNLREGQIALSPVSDVEVELTVVHVLLTDWGTGQSVSSGKISVMDGGVVIQSAPVDSDGTALFSLGSGEYNFVIEGGSLPEGYLPPSQQHVTAPYERLKRDYSPLVNIGDLREDLFVQVFAFRAGYITGQVTSPYPGLIDGASISLAGVQVDQPAFRVEEGLGNTGLFNVMVIPGQYRVQPKFDQSKFPVPRPAPTDVVVGAGESQTVDFQVDTGGNSVSGRLLDPPLFDGEQEILWESVTARLYPSSESRAPKTRSYNSTSAILTTTTDSNGEYAFNGISPGEYRITFSDRDFSPAGELSRLGAWIEPIEFTATSSGTINLGTHIAYRSRPCTYTGQLVSSSVRHDEIVCEVTYPYNAQSSRPPYVRPIEIDAEGRFDFYVHMSPDMTPAWLKLRRLGVSHWEREIPLSVVPNGNELIDIHFF